MPVKAKFFTKRTPVLKKTFKMGSVAHVGNPSLKSIQNELSKKEKLSYHVSWNRASFQSKYALIVLRRLQSLIEEKSVWLC